MKRIELFFENFARLLSRLDKVCDGIERINAPHEYFIHLRFRDLEMLRVEKAFSAEDAELQAKVAASLDFVGDPNLIVNHRDIRVLALRVYEPNRDAVFINKWNQKDEGGFAKSE